MKGGELKGVQYEQGLHSRQELSHLLSCYQLAQLCHICYNFHHCSYRFSYDLFALFTMFQTLRWLSQKMNIFGKSCSIYVQSFELLTKFE